MKKIMIALAAVAVGFAARAAVVDWQYKVTASTVNYNSGYVLYLVDAAKWDAVTKVTAATFADDTIVYGSTTFAAGTGKSSAKTYASIKVGTTEAGMTATALDDSIITSTGSHDFYYVILDTNAEPDTFYVSEKTTLAGRAGNSSEVTANAISVTDAAVQTAGWTAVATIPEPTSGMLMLLGLAGLALKRKRS